MDIRRRLCDFTDDMLWMSRLWPRRYSIIVKTSVPHVINDLDELLVDGDPVAWLRENARGPTWVNPWALGRYELLFARKADMAGYILANAV